MATTAQHPLVSQYLADLKRTAQRLPSLERDELLAEIRAHLNAALSLSSSEADVRNALAGLGSPEEIVAELLPDSGETGPTGRLALGLAIAALVLMLIPPFIFVAIPLGVAAVVLALSARRNLRATGQATTISTTAFVLAVLSTVIPILIGLFLISARSTSTTSSDTPIPITNSSMPN